MHEDVTAPDGWSGNKHFFFDGTNWTNNFDWVDP